MLLILKQSIKEIALANMFKIETEGDEVG